MELGTSRAARRARRSAAAARTLGLCALAAVSAAIIPLGGGAAAAPDPPGAADFPASSSQADILRWIASRTSIQPSAILVLEPKAVVAVERQAARDGGSKAEVVIREELIRADAAAQAGARSARFSLELDCMARQYRILGRTSFGLPDLRGEASANPQPTAWLALNESAPIFRAWQAACTPAFVFPFAVKAAAKSPPATPSPITPSPPGAYRAVLGSYSVRANALAASERLDQGFARALAGKRKSIRDISVNGRPFAVVTVEGFATAESAGDFCRDIKASALVCEVRRRSD